MNAGPPLEPPAEPRVGAAQLYAAFVSLTQAGFTDHQALCLVGMLLGDAKPKREDGQR